MSRFLAKIEWAHALKMSGTEALDIELQAERASALGTAGKRLEQALAALTTSEGETRVKALTEAQRRAWEFMVQREMAGLRDWPTVVRIYAIPTEVLHGMGAVAPQKQVGRKD